MSARIVEVTEESWDALKRDNAALRAQVERLKGRLAREREKARRKTLRRIHVDDMLAITGMGSAAVELDHAAYARFRWQERCAVSPWFVDAARKHLTHMQSARSARLAAHAAGHGVPR